AAAGGASRRRAGGRAGLMRRLACAVLAAGAAALAPAAEFRSVAQPAAVLYDAPSTRANRLYVVSRGYPLEIVVRVEGWAKVRDAGGELTWIAAKALGERRTVMVKVPVATVREQPEDA